ncbi:mediator of RNA polymerase II transcription subunit 4, partial [Tremellales sp. Uapishka_1]
MTYTLSNTAAPPSIRSALLSNLSTQTTLLTQLFTTLSQPSSSSTSLPSLYSSFQNTSADLSRLVEDVYDHQAKYRLMLEKKERVEALERRVRELLVSLEGDRSDLLGMVESSREVVKGIEKARDDPINVSRLVSHAIALSKTTSAPVSSLLLERERAQSTPWPGEAEMRMGSLFILQGSMSGVGDVGKLGDEIKEVEMVAQTERVQIREQEQVRKYDPDAVYNLDLNSDSDSE